MATIYPSSFNPISTIATTPSTSSQSSLPPSYAIPVHDHILPPGWQCKYDPKTNKYYFINEHLAPQHDFWKVVGIYIDKIALGIDFLIQIQPFSARYRASDSTVQRIQKMFPEIDESYIHQLMRVYQNRENLVISALLSEGHSKSYHSPPDEALFYKLKSYFPTVEPETIRQTLSKHNNVEHEVIASIIAGLGPHSRHQTTLIGSPKMKLRYLKLLYPDADEAILFDLLYNCDHNAQEAIERLDKMGYRKKETIRPSSAKVEKPTSITSELPKALRPKSAPVSQKLQFPPNVAEKREIYTRLEESFPKADRTLINMALECAAFDEEKARLFLTAMTPQDSEKYFPKDIGIQESMFITLACRGTQTNAFVETIAGTPITVRKFRDIRKSDVSTCTTEDGIIVEEKKKPLAKGPNPSLRKGPNIMNLIKSYLPWKGPDARNRQGPDPNNRKGPDSSLKSSSGYKAKGADPKNRKGPSKKK
ncbi:hypothetical protein B4U79_02655 [Dinothrombium tinctorium]|uniref:CUE domain-containing protein n=1 Tax=Dinothrombium tinctorium TaxID=1965070 RepID=A0A443QTF2_9ACAR|nr:hypothetical protein B4U79_02655 [Dinothrombium tinctorium]